MSSISPTPLPDPPLAGLTVDPVPPPPQYAAWERAVPVPRPLGAFACLCLHLPLPLTLVYAVLFLLNRDTAATPLDFDAAMVFAGATATTLVAVGAALVATARRLEPRVRRRTRLGLIASCLVAVCAMAASPRGRDDGAAVRVHAGEPEPARSRPLEVGHVIP